MSFRTLLRLRSAALQPAPAGRALKPPAAANATVPSSTGTAPYELLLPRIGYSSAYTSPAPAPAPRNNFTGTGRGSSSALIKMEPAKEGEDGYVVIVAGGGVVRGRRCPPGRRCEAQRSKAWRIYGEMYVLVHVLSWMIGRIIVLAARDCREWLRRYVREKFSKKR